MEGGAGCPQWDSNFLGGFCPSSPSQVSWGLRENSQPGDDGDRVGHLITTLMWDRAVRTPGA